MICSKVFQKYADLEPIEQESATHPAFTIRTHVKIITANLSNSSTIPTPFALSPFRLFAPKLPVI
jgi:hypothetical protein